MSTSRPSWLFVFPHPDDELAMAITMRRLYLEGASIATLWMVSDPTREAESRSAMKFLEVEAKMSFLALPDGDLVNLLGKLPSFISPLLSGRNWDHLVIPAFEQGHLDHDATHYGAIQAAQDCRYPGKIWEYPLYHSYLSRVPWINRFATGELAGGEPLTPYERTLKRQMSQRYPSQTIRRNLTFAQLRARLTGEDLLASEPIRPLVAHDYLRPSHASSRAAKIERSEAWSRWTASLQFAKQEGVNQRIARSSRQLVSS